MKDNDFTFPTGENAQDADIVRTTVTYDIDDDGLPFPDDGGEGIPPVDPDIAKSFDDAGLNTLHAALEPTLKSLFDIDDFSASMDSCERFIEAVNRAYKDLLHVDFDVDIHASLRRLDPRTTRTKIYYSFDLTFTDAKDPSNTCSIVKGKLLPF